MNPLISPAFKSLARYRAPEEQGWVSRYALRYAIAGKAEFGAVQRTPVR
jgi:hypothetical protein